MTRFNSFACSYSSVAHLALPVCAGLALLTTVPAQARSTREGEGRIAQCIRQAAGGKPWLEKTLWGLRDQEGGWIGAEVRNTNGSHDLGPLQINSWWVPKIATLVGRSQSEVRNWLMHDACFNAGAARWIFLSALRTTGDFWTAVGVYHSPTAWRQRRYVLSVARHMQRRFGVSIFSRLSEAETGVRNSDAAQITLSSASMYGFGILRDTSR